jgi:signal transduction histidine kinase
MTQNSIKLETSNEQQGGVAKHLILLLTLCILSVLVLVSAMQIYVSYERGKSELEKDLQQYALIVAPTLSQPLWNIEIPQTYLNMDGLLQGNNIYGVLILKDNGKEFASLGSILDKNNTVTCITNPQITNFRSTYDKNKCLKTADQFISTTQRITNEGKTIGTVTLYGNKNKITQLITPSIIATLISAIVILMTLTLATRLIVEQKIGKPLRSLSQQLRQLDYINIANTWTISSEFTARKDELGELSKTFDEMVLELISYQNDLEDIVTERTEKLRIANAIKSDFISRMSHEIRTPINGVLGLAELVLSEKHTPETTHRIEMIFSSGAYLLKIVNDILDLSKIEAGKLQLESIPIALVDLVDDVTSVFTNHIKRDAIELKIMIAEDAPKYVYADPLRLKQIFVNLISNAFKFTEHGQITISIKPVSETTLKFSVSDTGMGIAPEQADHLFSAFNQADISTTRNFGGTGLGLTICKELVELMGGQISVTSTLNAGSCFYFTLSLPLASEISAPEKSLSAPKTHTIKDSVKILVAEDNLVNQAVIKGMLNKLGATPVIIENGKLVVDHFHNGKTDVDVIFMDCEMPIMDGWEASQVLRNKNIRRANGSPLLIIGLSAHAVEGANQRALQSGMDDYLTKPLSMTALIAKLQQYDLLV